jgi:capsular exopolysaccharide synthesis family protein
MKSKNLEGQDHNDLDLLSHGTSRNTAIVTVPSTPSTPPEPSVADPGALRKYCTLYRRNALLLITVALWCGSISYLITLPQRPMYRSEAVLEIQSPNESFLNLRDFDAGSAAGPGSYVEAQVELLRGDDLIDRTVSKLGILEKPDLWRATSLAVFLRIRHDPVWIPTHDEMISRLKDGLTVHSGTQSRVVGIQFESTDPQFAADFANSLANELIEQNLQTRLQSAERTAESLAGRLSDLRLQMEKSGRELQAYAGATGLIPNQSGGTSADERLREIQSELSRAQAERASRESRYKVAASGAPESLADVGDFGPLRDTTARLTELKRQHAELSSTFAPTYFKVKTVAAQIAELERILQKERANILERIRNEYRSALGRQKLLQQNYDEQAKIVSKQAAASVHYNTLSHEVEANRVLYDAMLQKVKEAGIAAAVRASNIRILNRAKASARPYRPTPLLNAATGLLAGFFLAAAFVLIRDQTDGTIRYPGEVATYLSVHELGVIPSGDTGFDGVVMTIGRKSDSASRIGWGVRFRRTSPASWIRSGSSLTEPFLSISSSLGLTDKNGDRIRVFVVTSPDCGDGKSTIVSHLGVALANTNCRVLLIDADLRRPTLQRMFGLRGARGLAEILEEQRPIDDYSFDELFQPTDLPDLFVMPGGLGGSSVANFRFRDRLIDLMIRIGVEFEIVLIDTPPAIQYDDARILGLLADGVVLVFRALRTSRTAAWLTLRRFQDAGIPVAGTILNDWKPESARYSYGSSDRVLAIASGLKSPLRPGRTRNGKG